MVEEFWEIEEIRETLPPVGNPKAGLRKIGRDYARRMRRPEMLAIYRLIIAETQRFPDLGQRFHEKGKGPYLAHLNEYLEAETRAGTLSVGNIPNASRQFLATIAGQVFWSELIVPGCGGTDADAAKVVEEAVFIMLARYARK